MNGAAIAAPRANRTAPVLLPRTLGEALLVLRHRAGLGRDVTAIEARVPAETLSRYEKDLTAKPDLAAIRRIFIVLSDHTGDDMGRLWQEVGGLLDRIDA